MNFQCEQNWTAAYFLQAYSLRINSEIQILAVELDGKDGLVVTFSDGRTGGNVIEELLELRPVRDRMKIKKTIPNAPKRRVSHDVR